MIVMCRFQFREFINVFCKVWTGITFHCCLYRVYSKKTDQWTSAPPQWTAQWDLYLQLRALYFILSPPFPQNWMLSPPISSQWDYCVHYRLNAKTDSIKRLPAGHRISYFSRAFMLSNEIRRTSVILRFIFKVCTKKCLLYKEKLFSISFLKSFEVSVNVPSTWRRGALEEGGAYLQTGHTYSHSSNDKQMISKELLQLRNTATLQYTKAW